MGRGVIWRSAEYFCGVVVSFFKRGGMFVSVLSGIFAITLHTSNGTTIRSVRDSYLGYLPLRRYSKPLQVTPSVDALPSFIDPLLLFSKSDTGVSDEIIWI